MRSVTRLISIAHSVTPRCSHWSQQQSLRLLILYALAEYRRADKKIKHTRPLKKSRTEDGWFSR